MSIRAAVSAFIASLKKPGDPYFDNVAALLHMDGADGGTDFPDVNIRSFRIWTASASQTRVAQAKFGVSSMLPLAESGAYISTPSHADFDFGAGDFTVEMWVYKTSHASGLYEGLCVRDAIGGTRGWLLYKETTPANALAIAVYVGATAYGIADTVAMDLNVWTHVAATRRAGTLRLFKNGALVASRADLGVLSVGAPAQPCVIGSLWGAGSVNPNTSFLGYLDEARITKGVARYTSAFPVPARFPDANTTDAYFDKVVALLHFDDVSGSTTFSDVIAGNTWAVTGTGPAQSNAQVKFGQSAMACTNNGTNISASSAGAKATMPDDFTVEAWVYVPHANALNANIVSLGNESAGRLALYMLGTQPTYNSYGNGSSPQFGGTIPRNQWFHLAWAREGSTLRCYINGEQTGTQEVGGSVGNANGFANVGGSTNADTYYLDELRITKGVCRYPGGSSFTVPAQPFANRPSVVYDQDFDSVVALLHLNGVQGSTAVQDVSPAPKTFTTAGGAALTATGRFGGSSLRLAASGDYVSTANAGDFAWGLQDFCIEGWICPDNVTGIKDLFQSYGTVNASGVAFQQRDAKIHVLVSFNGSSWGIDGAATSSTLVAGQWTHVALTRVAGVFRLFSDGVLVYTNSSFTTSAIAYDSANQVRIGMAPIAGGNQYLGKLDEFRATRGVGRYAANFTPPLLPFGGAPPRKIDMLFDAGNGEAVFSDSGTGASTWTVGSGAVVCSTAEVLAGVSSLFIPAGGAPYLTAAASAGNLLPATKDFSLRFRARASSWLRPDSAGCYILSVQDAASTAAGTQFAIATNTNQFPALVYSDGTTRSVATGSVAIPTNATVLFELVRTGSTLALKINGAVAVSVTFSGAFPQPATPWRIGAPAGVAGGPTNGMYFDSFSLTA
jgi:hypothetical protein